MADRGEMDAHEATKLLDRLGVKLSLMMAYNPEANVKVERGHELLRSSSCTHVMVKSGIGNDSCHMHYGSTELHTLR